MVTADAALPGRDLLMPVAATHLVLDTPMTPPFPENCESIVVGMGSIWIDIVGAGAPEPDQWHLLMMFLIQALFPSE